MRANRVASADDYKLQSSFQTVRKTLLTEPDDDRLEKPLAYWVLPNDRRLPLAFLGRTLGELLGTPFEELTATPGIGQKKIGSLVKLLYRATRDQPPGTPFGMEELSDVPNGDRRHNADSNEDPRTAEPQFDDPSSDFQPDLVSEAMWVDWQQTIRLHGLGHEVLGHMAPSLQSLPTVIWQTPLENYDKLSLSEIRELKTHGEKRIRAVLSVFHNIHKMLSKVEPSDDLHVSLAPKFVPRIEAWVARRLRTDNPLTVHEVKQELAIPLVSQIQTDCGVTVSQLTTERLGIKGEPISVRNQAQNMNVTRTRVYQLLDECAKVMEVRWPDGRCRLLHLSERFGGLRISEREPAVRLFNRVRNLFFPPRFDPVDS